MPSAPQGEGDVTAAARGELRMQGVESSAVGQLVLALARRIDNGTAENGSALASLAKEFRASFVAASSAGTRPADPIDEVRAQRERRRKPRIGGGA